MLLSGLNENQYKCMQTEVKYYFASGLLYVRIYNNRISTRNFYQFFLSLVQNTPTGFGGRGVGGRGREVKGLLVSLLNSAFKFKEFKEGNRVFALCVGKKCPWSILQH